MHAVKAQVRDGSWKRQEGDIENGDAELRATLQRLVPRWFVMRGARGNCPPILL